MATMIQRFGLPGGRFTTLFSGWEAGHYALPDDPTGPILAPAKAKAQTDDEYRALTEAHERAGDMLAGALAASAERIVGDFLRPAFDEVIASARELRPVLEGVAISSTTAVTSAGPDAQRAFLTLSGELAPRYLSILQGRDNLLRLTGKLGQLDPHGLFTDTTAALADPGVPTVGGRALRPAGPSTSAAERLLWLASADGRPRLLGLAEGHERWLKYAQYLAAREQIRGGRTAPEVRARIDAAWAAVAA